MSLRNHLVEQRMLEIEKMLGAAQQRGQAMDEAMHQMAMQTLQQVMQGLQQVIGLIVAGAISG